MDENLLAKPDHNIYNNEDYYQEILAGNNEEEIRKFQAFHNLSDDQIELYRYFCLMRKMELARVREMTDKRAKENPVANLMELEMGAYAETIEWQVRDAIMVMREKGYPTVSSGFWGLRSQAINFALPCLEKFSPSPTFLRNCEEEGIMIEIHDKKITIELLNIVSLEKIKNIWNHIASELPDLGHKAEPSRLPAADNFRRKQEIFK
jgi:hypothetical protein